MIESPEIKLNFRLAPITDAPVYLNHRVQPLKIEHNGPFIRNRDGQLVCVQDKEAYLSDDEGKSWQSYTLFSTEQEFSASNSRSLLCTSQGTIILSFVNTANRHFKWRKSANAPTRNSYLYHYIVRSEDGGKSWQEPILLQKGYAAAATTLIELTSGSLIASAQNLDYEQARHYSLSFRSQDDGKSWQASNKLDIGGRGHHAGCYEGTLVELEDRVWFCTRTNRDYFWDAYSYDDGKTWTHTQPGFQASSSPSMLKRLASGRLVMVYNPLYPQGSDHFKRVSGQFSEVEASWHREELSIIHSDDNGKNWSNPVTLARCKDAWLSYPYVFEAQPGVLWITTMQSELRIKQEEKFLISK
ncbi:sialidase family protein [Thiomicrorhabdus sp.]|uniref:sialidase family protein n=1 Tax=Thiomicrorhabdus sp. TaxID=2039724 RepID=UPI0029C80E29|nr:sialidase family protein [Thiomicrorhabdus sp.]